MPANPSLFADPKSPYNWFLGSSTKSDLSIDVASVWADYSGAGVTVGVIDTQIDGDHEDLARAYDTARDYNFSTDSDDPAFGRGDLTDSHGTLVAGIIAGEGGNGVGTVGFAHGASLVGLGIDYGDPDVIAQVVEALNAATQVDIVNNSWSFVTNFSDNFSTPSDAPYAAAMHALATEGRDGLGTVAVFSAGNAGQNGSSNYHNFQNSPFAISVGAVERDGSAWANTSLGANVLVSSAGRNVQTTNLNDGYTGATGTSFAAPAVSAVVALMLEANPNLGYRDVQQILALSAERDGLDADPQGDGWRINGADNHNGGGMHYSDAFGFGIVNAHNAVRLAETWTDRQTADTRAEVTVTRDGGAELTAGAVDSVEIAIPIEATMRVEHVGVSLDLAGWPATGKLDVYLVSPEGTSVRLLYEHSDRANNGRIDDFVFTSVGTMGEMAEGIWTLKVVNRDPTITDRDGTPLSGRIEDVTLTIYGDDLDPSDDTYVYTDEFGLIYQDQDRSARSLLEDRDGGHDAINAAAVTSDTRIDLDRGQAQIAGIDVAIRQPQTIEDVYTGDGDDTVTGSAADNRIETGRGDDVIHFSAGQDVLDGGRGIDTLVVDAAFASVTGAFGSAGSFLLGLVDLGLSTVFGIERFRFTDVTYDFDTLQAALTTAAEEGDAGAQTPDTPSEPEAVPPMPPATDLPEGPAGPAPIQPAPPADDYDQTYTGTQGNDVINGGVAADSIQGQGGADTLRGRQDDDRLDGGAGNDRLEGDEGKDILLGGMGHDTLRGGADDDTLDGGNGSDRLLGGMGDDLIIGGDGDDRLEGGAGNDTLHGGAGRDVMTGGSGADLFVFDVADLDGTDVITDFDSAEGDQMMLIGLEDGSVANIQVLERAGASLIKLEMENGDLLQIRLVDHGDVDIQPVIALDDGSLLIA